MISVLVNGAKGKMGEETVRAVTSADDMTLVAALDANDDLSASLAALSPDVVVDFTHPSCVEANARAILEAGAHAVIGTTGLSDTVMADLGRLAESKAKGFFVIPNFAIGAVLMMTFAAKAAAHMPRVAIIELHHDKKADAPSGTAIKTAELIASQNPDINADDLVETELIPGARGGACQRIPIHSVRLPGYVASQEVILGGLGQTLSLRHDSLSRESFMPGVLLTIRSADSYRGLIYGLEKLL